ncbi:PEP-utilizing enzyme [Helicobacter burdigaliensis]|uniref:PEP-utilizing enzyme n=1 Tax=Helicobacter burdigaliensis TaxID=2315334 RepID=UPI000EF66682|nr:PEP-utilizing enzyme [Helicobacter burdigaliensis]
MQELKFISKAQNLKALQKVLKSAKILPLVITNKEEFSTNPNGVIKKILELKAKKFVVRSSSFSEDSKTCSNAGAFLSLLNVEAKEESIKEAILKVAHSMPNPKDEILIQPMLENIAMCGVAFSVDKDNFAPYYCIEFDRSGTSHAITDGSAKEKFSFFSHREVELEEGDLAEIIRLVKELEGLFKYCFIDVEFAKNKKGELYCLQVRPLIKSSLDLFNALPKEALKRLQKRFVSLQRRLKDLHGEKAIFGVMPDWNPAEIIGLKPKRLALSLYKEIVTDSIWAYQRDNYGYLNLRSHPLMHSFLGIPYIDVRLSFNSFIPKNLESKIASKLVDYYLKCLNKDSSLHDKIEFSIVFSSYDFNMQNKLKRLKEEGFNENELKRLEFSLLELTNGIIHPKKGLYLKDLKKIKKLPKIYKKIIKSDLSLLDKIYWLIEDCKRYGTLPFAGIARAGFIAMQMLNSLVEIGFFTQKEREDFLNSLHTISKRLSLASAKLSLETKEQFLKEFGHLRAGTYDILSPRYDEAFSKYFDLKERVEFKEIAPYVLDKTKQKELDYLLKEHGIKVNALEFIEFLRVAIEGREEAKFEFSRLLSKAISLIAELGEYYGIDKEQMAHLDIKSILSLYSSLYSKSPKERFLSEIAQNIEEYKLTQALKLPALLRSEKEIFSFFGIKNSPNFITRLDVVAKTARENEADLKDKIVLIYAADPGYDYLFTKGILGFITCYGGANSHMAIRASELGMPACIGVGEEQFAELLGVERLRLDCGSGQIICL